jgi:lactate dehydrogenase-like 2-hydroxyacid dehydrogenase
VLRCDGRDPRHLGVGAGADGDYGLTEEVPYYRDVAQAGVEGTGLDPGWIRRWVGQVGQYAVLGEDLAGKTVLILGYGSIGRGIEARLNLFGVTIISSREKRAKGPLRFFAV